MRAIITGQFREKQDFQSQRISTKTLSNYEEEFTNFMGRNLEDVHLNKPPVIKHMLINNPLM